MACFTVPAAEAVIVTAAAYAIRYRQKSSKKISVVSGTLNTGSAANDTKISFSSKLMWLARLLWGGAFLLAYEHVWHGEVVPFFPFLTAVANPADKAQMLSEMSTVGVTMAVLVTLVWVGLVVAANSLTKRAIKSEAIGT